MKIDARKDIKKILADVEAGLILSYFVGICYHVLSTCGTYSSVPHTTPFYARFNFLVTTPLPLPETADAFQKWRGIAQKGHFGI
jgi:hypothetical protein